MITVKKVLIIGVMTGLLLAGFAATGSTQGPPEDRALMERWVKAFHEGNAEALSGLYAPGAVFANWAGPFRLDGREAIRAWFASYFRAFPTRFLIPKDSFVQVYGETTIFNLNWTIMYVDAKGTMKTVYGRSSQVIANAGGQRLIVNNNASLLPVHGP